MYSYGNATDIGSELNSALDGSELGAAMAAAINSGDPYAIGQNLGLGAVDAMSDSEDSINGDFFGAVPLGPAIIRG